MYFRRLFFKTTPRNRSNYRSIQSFNLLKSKNMKKNKKMWKLSTKVDMRGMWWIILSPKIATCWFCTNSKKDSFHQKKYSVQFYLYSSITEVISLLFVIIFRETQKIPTMSKQEQGKTPGPWATIWLRRRRGGRMPLYYFIG